MKYLKMFEDFSDWDDEDEEDDAVYSEMDGYIESLKNSREKWGTFNILIGKEKTPTKFIIDDHGISSYVHERSNYINISFINEYLLDNYNILNYDSKEKFFEIFDDGTLTFRIYIDGDASAGINGTYTIMKFISDDDKERLFNFVSKMGVKNELLLNFTNYLKTN